MTHQIDISNLFNPTTEESWLYKEYKKQTMAQQTPKEKALELYSKYYNRLEHTLSEEYSPHEKDVAKQCALIAVDEVLNETKDTIWIGNPEGTERQLIDTVYDEYWLQVKQEIEKL